MNDRSAPRHDERGQTLSFWVFAVLISLALTLYVMNYTNTVRWHVRAQNAADTAAMTAIAADANRANERSMALYALAVSEYRLRSVLQSMLNAANAKGGCDNSQNDSGTDCDSAYDHEPIFYDNAYRQYKQALGLLRSISNTKSPGTAANPYVSAAGGPAGAAFSLASSNTNCWDRPNPNGEHPVFDCAFSYYANLNDTGPGSNEYVDVVTCRDVVPTAPGIFGGAMTPFRASGRAAATLREVDENGFSPGDKSVPDPGATGYSGSPPPYQPVEACPSSADGSTPCNNLTNGWSTKKAYEVDYSGLKVNAVFFVPEPTAPHPGSAPQVGACNKG